jgi:hypothetical protein
LNCFFVVTQGCSFLPTLGFGTESRWDSRDDPMIRGWEGSGFSEVNAVRFAPASAGRENGRPKDGLREVNCADSGSGAILDLEIGIRFPHREGVAANRAIGRAQSKDRTSSFLSHRNQAAEVLDGGKAVRVGSRCRGTSGLLKHAFAIDSGHAVHPSVVSLNRAAQANAVLLDKVAKRAHGGLGQ